MNGPAASSTAPAVAGMLRLHPRRTLVPLEFFGVLHGVKLDDALALVDDFKLGPAFNLSTSLDGRRKIHVWRECLEHYQAGRKMAKRKLAEIIAAVLPPLGKSPAAFPTVRGSELTFRFCCCHKRIADWVCAGELREVGCHDRVNQTAYISYESAAQFLESRLLGRFRFTETEEELDGPRDLSSAPREFGATRVR